MHRPHPARRKAILIGRMHVTVKVSELLRTLENTIQKEWRICHENFNDRH